MFAEWQPVSINPAKNPIPYVVPIKQKSLYASHLQAIKY